MTVPISFHQVHAVDFTFKNSLNVFILSLFVEAEQNLIKIFRVMFLMGFLADGLNAKLWKYYY